MSWLLFFAVIAIICLVALYILSGQDLRQFDSQIDDIFDAHPDDSAALKRLIPILQTVRKDASRTKSLKKGLAVVRDFADNISADLETDSEFRPVIANGVKAEWAIAKGADPQRRILFMHGGAFIFGSPKGHRKMADQLSKLANAAVLSVDYRMLPEHGRRASILDTQAAYHYILVNGPDGACPLSYLLVSGDSAGGNLCLMISSWSKKHAARRPDAVVAFSPSTDMTMTSPTVKANIKTDLMLGEGLGLLTRFPNILRAWIGFASLRMNPANELASPLFGDLAELPPTLIHASSNEMLLGESIRYVNRAKSMGSNVTLQVWKDQIHDWHLFNMGHGSANVAWQEIKKFIDQHDPAK
ncbi:alpha/beta hydrolase [Arenicella xantha]|uniref:Acetyl esterase/lipase n=1 Tax=Arenicella xantha TaxID=644221 RepID=A0A395JIF4_9GAMM|nr:alpha/beta hydrolase fold domain-containing protein [Arenicella xantha]RBP49369.1 acetyl esterase/lipase [Arenicella xantha]